MIRILFGGTKYERVGQENFGAAELRADSHGDGFTLLSFWMTIFKVGKNPLTALVIGLGFFAAAYLI